MMVNRGSPGEKCKTKQGWLIRRGGGEERRSGREERRGGEEERRKEESFNSWRSILH